MADLSIRASVTSVGAALAFVTVASGLAVAGAPHANADSVAYLINVTVRPRYNFANASEAIAYGNGICRRVGEGIGYNALVNEVKNDFNSADDYQGAYLINQAVNELCPANIWQLRNAAIADNHRAR